MIKHIIPRTVPRLLLILLIAGLSLSTLAAPAAGQTEPIRVVEMSAEYAFSERVDFSLSAEGDSPIQQVILFYRVDDDPILTRAYPQFQPGTRLHLQWTWELYPGMLAPGSLITYFWELHDAGGRKIRTEELSLRYQDDRFDWREFSQGLVHLYTYRNNQQGEELLAEALAVLDRQQQEIGISLEKPIHIYVYANRSDMRLAIPSRSERYDEMTITLGMVVSDDTLLLLGSESDIDKTLAHELSHILVGQATENPFGDLPRWLDEGLAMYAEGELPARNSRALEDAVRSDDLISVRSLSGYSGDPEKVDLFYAEAYSVVSFLIETFGQEKMVELLHTFREGTYQEDALQRVYGFGLDELDTRWRASLGLPPRQLPSETPLPSPEMTQPAGEVMTPEPIQPSPTPAPASPAVCSASLLPGLALAGLFFLFRPRNHLP